MPTEDELESIVSAHIDGTLTPEERESIRQAARQKGGLWLKQLAEETAKGGGKH